MDLNSILSRLSLTERVPSPQEYVDRQGLVWHLDPETGEVTVYRDPRPLLYESADCTGTAYVEAFLPRTTFRVAGDPSIRVRPDGQASQKLAIGSSDDGTGCTAVSITEVVVPAGSTIPNSPIVTPTLPYQFPIHAEVL